MLKWIKNYLLQQEIKRFPKIQKQFAEWDKLNSGAIVVGSGQYSIAREFAGQSGKNFDILVVHDDKIALTRDAYLSLNKKDFSFFGIPKPEIIKKIKGKTYDILINADFNNTAGTEVVTGLVSAKCKLGPESLSNNEMLDISIKSEQQDFLKQAQKYLMMIKS